MSFKVDIVSGGLSTHRYGLTRLTRLDYELIGIGYVSRLNVTCRALRRICETGSYQMYFNMDAVLNLTDALGPSPLLLEQQYDLFGHSFCGAARTQAVRRVIGLIIVQMGTDRIFYNRYNYSESFTLAYGLSSPTYYSTNMAEIEKKNYNNDV